MDFTRRELYELVWTEPLTKLGRRFGISDVGLAKACRRANVPVPPRGYWARLAAGQSIDRTSLPEADEHVTSFTPTEPKPSFRVPEDDVWLSERNALEADTAYAIEVEEKPRRWHPVIVRYRDAMRADAKEIEGSRKTAERHDQLPEGSRVPASWSDGYKWRMIKDRGQLVLDTHRATAFRVSIGAYERALLLMNSFALAAEKRGFSISDNPKAGRIRVEGHGGQVDVRITERLEQQHRERKRYDRSIGQEPYKVPTGRLRLFLERDSFTGSSLEDKPGSSVELRLNDAFRLLNAMIIRSRVAKREDEAREKRWKEDEQRRALAEQKRQEEARRLREEQDRRKALEAEAQNWARASAIRGYVMHVLNVAATSPADVQTSLASWKDWALAVAADLDPTIERTSARLRADQ
jgi:hypothetical protein